MMSEETRNASQSQVPSQTHPLNEGTRKQGYPVPQRGRQEAPAEILLWMVTASGPSRKTHRVHI